MIRKTCLTLAASGLALLVACAPREEAPEPEVTTEEMAVTEVEEPPMVAIATLQPRADTTAGGTVSFTEVDGTVTVVVDIQGAPPGTHGFHVHETGDCSAADFTSAGGHFNPGGTEHACPPTSPRHAGDLGNIEIGEDGSGHLEAESELLTVADGPSSVVGKAVVLHEAADDCSSQPTGEAGGRLACGVVSRAQAQFPQEEPAMDGMEGMEGEEGMMEEGAMEEEGAEEPPGGAA